MKTAKDYMTAANAVVERMEVVACEHEAGAAVEGEVAMVERGGGTGLDALSAVIEQAAIVHVQRAGVFQIHPVAAIAVDARVIKIDDAPVGSRQPTCTVVPNFGTVHGQVGIRSHVDSVFSVPVYDILC